MKKFKVWELPRKKRLEQAKHGTASLWCAGKCGLTHRACLKARNIDLTENDQMMESLELLAIKPLFTPWSKDRINPFMPMRYKNVKKGESYGMVTVQD